MGKLVQKNIIGTYKKTIKEKFKIFLQIKKIIIDNGDIVQNACFIHILVFI